MAFINQDEEDNKAAAPNEAAPVPAPNAGAGSTPMGSSTASLAAPKGSGRFTNIQKYISANQGASDRLAGGVNTKIQGQINPNLKKTEDNLSNIRQGIASGRGLLDQGNQFNEQVQKADFDAQGFASNDDNVNQFNQFRTGQALDEGALRNQAQTSQQQALAAQQKTQQLGQQFGSEQGRQNLLKQTFSPGRNYTTGQQRLDGLFLQQATPQMKSIEGSIRDAANKFGSFNTQLGTETDNVNSLAEQEALLSGNLTTGIKSRESDLMNSVMGKQQEINQARMAQQKDSRDQFGNLLSGKNINQDFANLVNLKEEDKLYNVLKKNANIDDYLKFNDTLLTGADQLANQQERAKYDAIARLAGIDPNNKQIKLDTKVANAVDTTGLLRSGIDTSKKAFEDFNIDRDQTSRGGYSTITSKFNNLIPHVDSTVNPIKDAMTRDLRFATNSENAINSSPELLAAINAIQQAGNTQHLSTGMSIGVTPLGRHYQDRQAALQSLIDAYGDLGNRGYYQDVNIENPTLKTLPKLT